MWAGLSQSLLYRAFFGFGLSELGFLYEGNVQ
jgi:hypothetical protein